MEHTKHIIMRYLILLFFGATAIFFQSCSSEALLLPEQVPNPKLISNLDQSNNHSKISSMDSSFDAFKRGDITIQLRINTIVIDTVKDELTVDFVGLPNLLNSIPGSIQNLVFIDTNNAEVILSFQVSGFNISYTNFEVTYSIAGHDLTGLDLGGMQAIVIQDELIN